MAHVHADRVADLATTEGTSNFTALNTPPVGFRTLDSALAGADTFWYCIAHQSLSEWEVGLGTYAGSHAFERTTVYASSNSNALVDFSAGTKDVFITTPASTFVAKITGPGSAVDSAIALFDGTTGKLVKDSGMTILDEDDLVSNSANAVPTQQSVKAYSDTKITGPGSAVDSAIALFDGTTGKMVKDSGMTTNELADAGAGLTFAMLLMFT